MTVVASLALRLRHLGGAYGVYDEGVYLQTLMAMAAGHGLYRETFHSQPPAFLLSLFPFFLALGRDVWAARFGVVVWSLAALPAAALLGDGIGGRAVAVTALALAAFDPAYLAQSRTVEAEAPQIAFALVAVALAFHWARAPDARAAPAWAFFASAAAMTATLCKLTGVAAFLPLAQLLADAMVERRRRGAAVLSAIAGLAGAVVVLAAFVVPFLGALGPLWRQVAGFHLAARGVFSDGPADHGAMILQYLATTPLSYAALLGAAIAILRRDRRVAALLLWLAASAALLINQTPLFDHHLVTLEPGLLALAILGFSRHAPAAGKSVPAWLVKTPRVAAMVGLAVVAGDAALGIVAHDAARASVRAIAARNRARAQDIAEHLDPQGLVITDCQLAAALAQRRTPAALVDTSFVRIKTGALTAAELIAAAARPDVRMVLFCGGQLDDPAVAPFRRWVAQHLRLLHAGAAAMWIKPR